jgi:antirestriction protein ArdC
MSDMSNTMENKTTEELTNAETNAENLKKPKKTLSEHRIDTTKMLLQAINDDKSPWQHPEAVEKIGLPVRAANSQEFKGFNAIVLMTTAIVNNYNDPRWVTSKDTKDFGLLIKQGEKATYVETTDFYKRDEKGGMMKENGKPVKLQKPNVYLTAVFNVAQLAKTRNIERLSPAPEYKPKEPDLELAEKILKNSPAQIEHSSLKAGERPRYNGYTDVISMPPQESFASKEGYYAEAIHQIAHSTGFSKRDTPRKGINDAPRSKGNVEEELCGEMASLFLRLQTGLKLEPSHQEEHKDVKKFMEMNCLTEQGEVFRNVAFAIAGTHAERMTKQVMELAQEKTQEKNVEQAPVQEKTQNQTLGQEAPEQTPRQEKTQDQEPEQEAPEWAREPERTAEPARKSKRGKALEIDLGR